MMKANARRMQRTMLDRRAPTRCEVQLYRLLDELLGPDHWERQHLVGHWVVDAAVPQLRLVLQADGNYWHGRTSEARSDPRVRSNMANDRRQDRWMAQHDWVSLRLWDSELLERTDECRDRIASTLDNAFEAAERR